MTEEEAICTACPLYKTAKRQLLVGDGPTEAKIMLVGDAPGRSEEAQGVPFVGDAGRLLNTLLEQCGLQRSEVFVTQAVRCRPTTPSGDNRKPTVKEINACRRHLEWEVAQHKPQQIIALGNEALKSLTGLSGIKAYRGQAQKLRKGFDAFSEVMPTFHPAFAVRFPENEEPIKQDITTAVRALRGGFTEIETPYAIYPDQSLGMLDYNSFVWAWDIETSARDMHDPELFVRFLAIDDGTRVILFIGDHVVEAVEIMRRYTAQPDRWLVGHNASAYDRAVIKEKYEVDLKTHDTQLLAHLVDETQSLKLQDLAVRHLGVSPWKDDFDVHFWRRGPQTEEEWATSLLYNARDTRYDRLLFLHLWEQATPEEKRLYKEHNLPVSRALSQMERNGTYISIDNCRAAIEELEIDQQIALLELKNATKPEFNPGSHKQVRELLFSDLMLPKQGRTAGGESSTDVEALKRIRALDLGGKIPDLILKYRENGTLLGFPRAFLEHATVGWTDKNNILHPSLTPPWIYPRYSMTVTDTGRTSSFNPNLQNTPRDGRVRSCVAAPPGYVFIECDGSQMEMRFIGEFAGPQSSLFQEYATKPNPDVHMTMALRLTGKSDPATVTKDERDRSKPPNFSFGYNPSWDAWKTYQRIALTDYDLNVSEKEARFAHDAFKEWGVRPWWLRVKAELEATGCVTSIFGRKRRLPNIYSSDEYQRMEAWRQGCNAVVQSAASDYFLMFLTTITGRGFHVVGAIHDAVHVLVPDNDAQIESAIAWLKYDFEVTTRDLVAEIFGYRFQLPLTADVSVGRYWGDKTWKRLPR